MKENLSVQFVFPDFDIPEDYLAVIESIDHCKIMPIENACNKKADVLIIESIDNLQKLKSIELSERPIILRVKRKELFDRYLEIVEVLNILTRLNIVIADIVDFEKEDFKQYQSILSEISECIKVQYQSGKQLQMSNLTDRIVIDSMNNCNAGLENITLAPNGKFYACPGFYYDDEDDFIGTLENGLIIKNKHLYSIEFAPICRSCDAYHCKRCIWMNKKSTLEVNTPSHEQCVIAHLERNASRELLSDLHMSCIFTEKQINAIDYLDPFDLVYNNE